MYTLDLECETLPPMEPFEKSAENILTCGVDATESGGAASLKGILRWLPGRLPGSGRGLGRRLGGRCLGHVLAGDCWRLQI